MIICISYNAVESFDNSPQTSDLIENLLYASASGAVHLIGNLVPARASYISASSKRDSPKSATFTRWFSPTKQLRAAKSLHKMTENIKMFMKVLYKTHTQYT